MYTSQIGLYILYSLHEIPSVFVVVVFYLFFLMNLQIKYCFIMFYNE